MNNARLDPVAAAPALMKAWHGMSMTITAALDPKLAELVKIRASQINGCAVCANMHSVFARDNGETDQRLLLLATWREAPCYTDRERAALEWTEALTRLSERDTLEQSYAALKSRFSDAERVGLTLIINVINGWNRIARGFGGWVEPAAIKAAAATG